MEDEDNKTSMGLYLGIGIAVGTSLGVSMGAVAGDVGMGVALGPALGLTGGLLIWMLKTKEDDSTDLKLAVKIFAANRRVRLRKCAL